jgi:hypothetical protein
MLKNKLDAYYKQNAIRCYSDSLSIFGNGPDLRLYKAKNGKKSYTHNTCQTYELAPSCNQE